jgi:hypothetical protein
MPARTHRTLVALLALLGVCGAWSASALAADTPLAPRFAQTLRGDVTTAGNTLMSCPSNANGCTAARARTGPALDNNSFNMARVDTDGDNSTFTSSSSQLSIPAGATVVWAGLYWSADTSAGSNGSNATSAGSRGQVRFRVPGGSYQTLTAAGGDLINASGQTTRYRGFRDVTSQVASARGGTYWVANVQSGTGNDRFAGWGLVVAYRDSAQAIRRVNVYDGLAFVDNASPSSTTIQPFFTPAAGAVRSNFGLLAFDGDTGLTPETFALNGSALANAVNPSGNPFNGTISQNGAYVGAKNPDYVNQMGMDFDGSAATGVLGNARGSATLALANGGIDNFTAVAFYLVSDEGPALNTGAPTVAGEARDGEVLSAAPGIWAGTPSISYSYAWQRCDADGANCAAIPGQTGSSYTLGGADIGTKMRALVTATNDAGASAPAASAATAAVAQRPPTSQTAPALSGTARDGNALSTTLGTWRGSGPFDYAIQWLRCNASGGACAPIAGATASSYTLTGVDVGATLRSEVTASNSAGAASARSGASSIVAAAAPSLLTAATIAGTANEREVLTAATGSWRGTQPLTFAYRWQRCDSAGNGCADIAGAAGAGATYTLTPADVGHALRVTVTASNAAGSATSRSAQTAVVAAALARNTRAPAVSIAADKLNADPGSWEGTLGSITYQWQRCDADGNACADLAGATAPSLTIAEADRGLRMRVRVTMTNAAGPATATSAPSARVPYLAPVSLVPPSIAGDAVAGTTLTAHPGVWRARGTLVLTYAWLRCNADGAACTAIAGATGTKYVLGAADVGASVRVAVTLANETAGVTARSEPTPSVLEPVPATPATVPAPPAAVPPATGEVLGASAEDLSGVAGSLVGPSSCRLLVGGTQERTGQLGGIGMVRVRALAGGPITAADPLRLSTTVVGGSQPLVRYRIDGNALSGATVAPSALRRRDDHLLVVTLRRGSAAPQSLRLNLQTTGCATVFGARRTRTAKGAALRLRVDARTAIGQLSFALPSALAPQAIGRARPVGTLRLFVAGQAKPQSLALTLPAKGAPAVLLRGAGGLTVTYTGGRLVLAGLPARTAAAEVTLNRVTRLDGATTRRAIRLDATLTRAGAAAETLTRRTRAPR